MNASDWQLLNDLASVLADYRRSYHSIPDAYGYHHLGVVRAEAARRADAVLVRAERTLVQEVTP